MGPHRRHRRQAGQLAGPDLAQGRAGGRGVGHLQDPVGLQVGGELGGDTRQVHDRRDRDGDRTGFDELAEQEREPPERVATLDYPGARHAAPGQAVAQASHQDVPVEPGPGRLVEAIHHDQLVAGRQLGQARHDRRRAQLGVRPVDHGDGRRRGAGLRLDLHGQPQPDVQAVRMHVERHSDQDRREHDPGRAVRPAQAIHTGQQQRGQQRPERRHRAGYAHHGAGAVHPRGLADQREQRAAGDAVAHRDRRDHRYGQPPHPRRQRDEQAQAGGGRVAHDQQPDGGTPVGPPSAGQPRHGGKPHRRPGDHQSVERPEADHENEVHRQIYRGRHDTAVYLPVYLIFVVRLGSFHALVITGTAVGLAAVARLAGGWWTDRRPTVRLLVVCYATAAGLCLLIALAPRVWWLTVPVVAAISVCHGVASGALLALIGKAARMDSAGAVMGVTGAMATLGALLTPLLLAGVDRLSRSYGTAWVVLAAVLVAVAFYVHTHGLHIGLGLAVQVEPEPSPTATTVAVVDGADTELGAAAVVARLAELATSNELVVVYGFDEPARPRLDGNVLVTGLRDRLPRRRVASARVIQRGDPLRRLALLLGEIGRASCRERV